MSIFLEYNAFPLLGCGGKKYISLCVLALSIVLLVHYPTMSSSGISRAMIHRGTWFEAGRTALFQKIDDDIKRAERDMDAEDGTCKAIISPHAGLSYCSETMAYGFARLKKVIHKFDNIFILAFLHRAGGDAGILSLPAREIASYAGITGAFPLNQTIINDIEAKTNATRLTKTEDEEEHSLEMQLPMLDYIMGKDKRSIVPIYVNDLFGTDGEIIANTLLPYFTDSRNAFIVSSDFMHYGKRFNYVGCDPNSAAIKAMNMTGAEIITRMKPSDFSHYIRRTGNTICGRNPIMILLKLLENANKEIKAPYTMKIEHYSASNNVFSVNDSSVSYMSIVAYQQ